MTFRFILTLFGLSLLSVASAQKINHSPKTYVAQDGKIFWNQSQPVFVHLSVTPEESGVVLTNANQPALPIYFTTEGINYIRTQNAILNQGKQLSGTPSEVLLPVYVDGTSPITNLAFQNAVVYTKEKVNYIGKGLKITMASGDAVSGVEAIYYSINDEEYVIYNNDFSVEKEGSLLLKYYAVDHVGNVENLHETQIVQDFNPPISKFQINGRMINEAYSYASTIQLSAFDNLSGVKTINYRLDDEDFNAYNGKEWDMNKLSNGYHTLQFYAIDQVENKEEIQSYEFYFDTSAPLTAADILGDRFIVEDQIYFSGRTKLKLTAVDNKVGVKEIMYSINNEQFKAYDQPFYLPSTTGFHKIKYYAVDNFNNKTSDENTLKSFHEFDHQATKIYVDLTGPDLSYAFNGYLLDTRDTVFVNSNTEILFKATDGESGVQKITYSLEGSAEEFDFDKGLSFDQDGYHVVDFYGYDNVNNRNVSHMDVYVDNKGPKIFYFFSSLPLFNVENESDIYSSEVSVYLAAQDDHVGLKGLYYTLNENAEIEYNGKIKDLQKNKVYTLNIHAIDLLGNESVQKVIFRTGNY